MSIDLQALPRLTDREKLTEMLDPVLQGQYQLKELIQVISKISAMLLFLLNPLQKCILSYLYSVWSLAALFNLP
jgi:hypothetical protein